METLGSFGEDEDNLATVEREKRGGGGYWRGWRRRQRGRGGLARAEFVRGRVGESEVSLNGRDIVCWIGGTSYIAIVETGVVVVDCGSNAIMVMNVIVARRMVVMEEIRKNVSYEGAPLCWVDVVLKA